MNYDEVVKAEEMRVYREWLPFCKGSPKRGLTYDDQYDRVNLLFFTDSHIDFRNPEESLDNVARTIAFANESPVPFDALVHGGDIITPFWKVEKEIALERARSFFALAKKSKAPFLFTKGNHDLNDWGNLPQWMLTDQDWGELFLDGAEERYGIVRQNKEDGNRSTWHYYDIEDKKIRIVVLDMQDTDKATLTEEGTVRYHGGESAYLSNEQMNWIVTDALDFHQKPEKDWGVIFVFHQYSERKDLHEPIIDKLLELCDAFQKQGTYTHQYKHPENSFFDLDILADFTSYAQWAQKPHMICWLLGHDHEDQYEIKHGFPIIRSLNHSATTVSGDARVVRVPGTVTQNSFDIVNIDPCHRKIRLFRYGAGVNCYGEGGNRFLPDGLSY
ncbi:MAG: hypothetical protein E7399_08075 [Ruminococcaceae bacterium]|nr:hypothetical protein [Oscillospiraceae bacterium]